MGYIYNDEDNAPMYDENFERWDPIDINGHNPTVYTSYAEARAYDKGEEIPFNDPPKDGCWNCLHFNWKHEACTTRWNNMDESYYNPDIDDRQLTDCCDDWDEDKDAVWEEVFGGDEFT